MNEENNQKELFRKEEEKLVSKEELEKTSFIKDNDLDTEDLIDWDQFEKEKDEENNTINNKNDFQKNQDNKVVTSSLKENSQSLLQKQDDLILKNQNINDYTNKSITKDEKEIQKLSKELEELKLIAKKQQLQNEIKNRKYSTVSAEDIISLKENEEENNFEESQTNTVKPNGLGVAGAILSIIGGSFRIFMGILLLFAIIGIPILIGAIYNIKFALKFKEDFEYKTKSGILSIFFGSLLAGIFILVSQPLGKK